jgi:hypothetical protein
MKEISDLKLPIHIDDSIVNNFMVGEDGGQYYVDQAHVNWLWVNDIKCKPDWNIKKLLEYMENRNISAIGRRIVLRSIARLDSLVQNNPE